MQSVVNTKQSINPSAIFFRFLKKYIESAALLNRPLAPVHAGASRVQRSALRVANCVVTAVQAHTTVHTNARAGF